MNVNSLEKLELAREDGMKKLLPDRPKISVGLGTCGIGNGADSLYELFGEEIKKSGTKISLSRTGCFGFCAEEPLVNIYIPGKPLVVLSKVTKKDVKGIVAAVLEGEAFKKKALCKIEEWDHLTGKVVYGKGYDDIPVWSVVPFFKGQKKIVLRNAGLIDPEDIDEYIAVGGYSSLYKVLSGMSPEDVINEVKASKLRGRGGAGFPTGRKWELMAVEDYPKKYIICNADEGDPGAYMNRNEIESDPHMLIEGMIIGAYAMGSDEGVIYIRAEYPLAVKRIQKAIAQAEEYGFLGRNIFGKGFDFHIDLVEGAGAFVCGEETALIASIEGKAGSPTVRPPFPAQRGLWGLPTNINNVETWCNIPVIISKGGVWFSQTGTEKSSGTKVFSLVGKIKNTGLVEMPLGSSIQNIVYAIGGGTGTSRKVKAVQTGGPSGGCIPKEHFNTPVDYESLNSLGAIMGSGGMVVMDDDNCMVDVARYFTECTTSESCGKCTPCREGLFQSLKILNKIAQGQAAMQDLADIQNLGEVIKDTALCGLGQTGPNPVLSTIRYFRDEYEEHILKKRCASGVCQDLFVSQCMNSCPLGINIPGFLEMLKENKLEEAFEAVMQDNPLPSSTGRICHFHCKMRCRRDDIDDPIAQGEVHRYIADKVYETGVEEKIIAKMKKERLKRTDKEIAVIGGGPAGLTAAYYLVRLGHSVDIYESAKECGGILRFGIPEYRLPKKILQKEIGFIKKLGAKFITGTKVDADMLKTISGEYDAVFIATGAYKNMPLGIEGEDLSGVISGTSFLEEIKSKKPKIGKKVLVIGAGNVAIDAARTALRLGSDVTVVYRRDRDDMPANRHEIEAAEDEGVKFVFFAAPVKLNGTDGKVRSLTVSKMKAGDFDVSGRRKPVATNETYDIPCDTVMRAIGERVDPVILEGNGIVLRKDKTVSVDLLTLSTSLKKVYAGGDVVTGPSTAVEAMAYGKRAAESIDAALMGESRFNKIYRSFSYSMKADDLICEKKKQTGKELPVDKRIYGFEEVSLGLTRDQAVAEAERCLRCDIRTS